MGLLAVIYFMSVFTNSTRAIDGSNQRTAANSVKKLPREWINEDNVSMNFQFLRYAQPLIQGEVTLPHDTGLPVYARLDKVRVDKTLAPYETA